jgi:predicted amino acid racemase
LSKSIRRHTNAAKIVLKILAALLSCPSEAPSENSEVEAVVLLMVDMGNIREGIWFENREYLEEAVKQTLELPNLELYGLGTNFSCYGNVQPTVENGRMFVQIAR